MQDKIKQVFAKVKHRWQAASRKLKVFLGCGLLVVVAVVAVVLLMQASRPYAVLFSGLSRTDQTAILTYFSDQGITEFRVEDDSILVPESQKQTLMAQVLVAGYPSSGYDYGTYLNNVGSLTTEAERNQLILYDLQDYMAAVICKMEGVESADVLLTPGEDHTYVLGSGTSVDATAAVQVTMENGVTLTDNQVKAIRSLVSHGLSGLNVENVTIIDAQGNSYSSGDNLSDAQDSSQLKLELEEKYNNLIRARVLQVLQPLYGEDNVRVSVNTVVDLDRSYTDSTNYTLEDWAQGNGDGIIGSEVWNNSIIRDDDGTVGGVVGTETNSDLNTYVTQQTQPDGSESVITTSGQTDHLVDTTQQQVERTAGYISDVMVAVTINATTAGSVNAADLYSHVGRAAGISAADQQDKISILVSPFYTAGTPSILPVVTAEVPEWVTYAILGGAGLLALLLLLLIILLVRRRRKKKRKAQQAQQEARMRAAAAELQAPAQQPDIMEMQTERSMELRQDIRKFTESNPEIAAQMIRNWMRESDGQ